MLAPVWELHHPARDGEWKGLLQVSNHQLHQGEGVHLRSAEAC